MSTKEKSCVLCHAYLFPEDDVVYCPECGAPHHRECYNGIGKCALAEFHGTENQYDKIKAQEPKEEQKAEEQESKTEYQTPFGVYSPIDFLGGVNPEEEIAEGVTAKQAANFVLSNTMRYIPKFKKLKPNAKNSWNFLAFLFPSGWFLSRKMYKNGIICGCLEILAMILTIPFRNILINLGVTGTATYTQMYTVIYENKAQFSPAVMLVALVGVVISLIVSIISAIYGDWLYKKHTVNSIIQIEGENEDKSVAYRKKGGVNIFLFLLGYLAISYIPAIISAII